MTLQTPINASYDVVIVGGAIMGASTAWFLSDDRDFDGSVLVVERDTRYVNASTMRPNSCMRQQFSTELNVRISQFAAELVKKLPRHMGFARQILAQTAPLDSQDPGNMCHGGPFAKGALGNNGVAKMNIFDDTRKP